MNIIFNDSSNNLGGVETFLNDLANLISIEHNVYFLVSDDNNYYKAQDRGGQFKYIYKNKTTSIEFRFNRSINLEKEYVMSQLDEEEYYVVISFYFSNFQYALAIFGDNSNFKLLHFWQHPQDWINNLFLAGNYNYAKAGLSFNKKKYNYQKRLLLKLQEKSADYCGLNKKLLEFNSFFYGIELRLNKNSFAFPTFSKCKKSDRNFTVQSSKSLKILWVGRFDWFKIGAIEYIAKSIDYLSNRFNNFNLTFDIVGHGQTKFEFFINELVCESVININFLGKINYSELPYLFAKYDLGIGMGITVKNMSDCSLPTILIDSIDHTNILEPACVWFFESEIDDSGDGYYHSLSGSVQKRSTLIDLIIPIIEAQSDLEDLSKKSKINFDENYSMQNSLTKFYNLINESNFCGTNYPPYIRPMIYKIGHIIYRRIPIKNRSLLLDLIRRLKSTNSM